MPIRSCLTLSALCLVYSALADSPQMYRTNAAHTGVLSNVGSGAYGGFLWRIQTNGTVRSTPTEYAGLIYIGAGDGFLRVINPETGDVVFKKQLGSPITSCPAVTQKRVVVVTQDGRVVGMDRKTGRVKYTIATGPDLPVWEGINGDFWTSSVNIDGGVGFVGGGNGDVVAFDINSGDTKWKFHGKTRFHTTPAIANGMAFIGGFNGKIYGLDAKTGHLKWTYKTLASTLDSSKFGFDRNTVQSSAAVSQGKVFVGARDGLLYCLEAKTGKLVWKYDHVMSWVNSSPSVAGNMVYAGSSDKRFVQGIDINTGKEVWRTQTGLIWTAQAVAGSTVFSTDGDGRFTAMDRFTGKKKWEVVAPTNIWSSPFLSGSRGVFGCDDGGIYCFRIDSATPLKKVVYWDDAEALHTLAKFKGIRDSLQKRGYSILGNAALGDFMKARITDRQPSTIVMTMALFPEAAPADLAKRYMANGGKIVWLGIPPKMWEVEKSGNVDMVDINWKATKNLIGVQSKTIFDSFYTTPTAEGEKWGLHGSWMSDFASDPKTVTTVLAKDDHGFAEVWFKSFGGRPGSGFVRMIGMTVPGASFVDMIVNVAETFPKR